MLALWYGMVPYHLSTVLLHIACYGMVMVVNTIQYHRTVFIITLLLWYGTIVGVGMVPPTVPYRTTDTTYITHAYYSYGQVSLNLP